MSSSNTQFALCAIGNVLIADDDSIVRQVLRKILEGAGIDEISEASDGVEALQNFAVKKPDMVCLDVEMPGITGIDVLAKIRSQSPNTIVLLISAFTTTQNVLGAIRLNADGIIAKPFTREKVIGEIERALSKKRNS